MTLTMRTIVSSKLYWIIIMIPYLNKRTQKICRFCLRRSFCSSSFSFSVFLDIYIYIYIYMCVCVCVCVCACVYVSVCVCIWRNTCRSKTQNYFRKILLTKVLKIQFLSQLHASINHQLFNLILAQPKLYKLAKKIFFLNEHFFCTYGIVCSYWTYSK